MHNILPAFICSVGTLFWCGLAWNELNRELVGLFTFLSLLTFSYTYLGYWAYSRYYATRKPDSAKHSVLYTLFFVPYFLALFITGRWENKA